MAGNNHIIAGIDLFNNHNFFEAHDFFEELWMESKSENREFYQGMVQISVGFYHLISENFNGAKSQLQKGLQKLDKYPDFFKGINLLKFRQDINWILRKISLFYSKKNYNFEVTNLPFIEIID